MSRKGKVVFVTGGGGRVGRALSRELVRKGYEVRALSHEREFVHTMPAGVVPYVGSLSDKKVLEDACKGADTVFHLAARYKASTRNIMDVNVAGTSNVMGACRRCGVGRVIFSSTVDVYGRERDGVLTEESVLKPSDRYGHSKALAEGEVVAAGGGLEYTIFRMAAVYGPSFEESYFKLFRAIKEGKAYIIGDGTNCLALVHIEDVVSAFMLAAESKKAVNSIYNLSDGVKYTQEGLMDIAADMLKVDRPKRHISPLVVKLVAKSRGLDSDELRFLMSNRIIDIGKVRKELGFRPSMDIMDAGTEMVRDFLNR